MVFALRLLIFHEPTGATPDSSEAEISNVTSDVLIEFRAELDVSGSLNDCKSLLRDRAARIISEFIVIRTMNGRTELERDVTKPYTLTTIVSTAYDVQR